MGHRNCEKSRACPACRRSDDAFEMMCGTFGAVVLFTFVCPVGVLLVFAGGALAGRAGAWSVGIFLAVLPLLVWAYVRFFSRP